MNEKTKIKVFIKKINNKIICLFELQKIININYY